MAGRALIRHPDVRSVEREVGGRAADVKRAEQGSIAGAHLRHGVIGIVRDPDIGSIEDHSLGERG